MGPTSTPSRRAVLAAAGMAATAATVAACSGGGGSGGGSGGGGGGQSGAGPGLVTLDTDNPTWAEGFKKVGTTMKSITSTGITPVSVPTTENYQQVVKTALQTNKTADIVKWWNGYRLTDLARTNQITDLSDMWSTLETAGKVDPALKKSFTTDGKVYGIPLAQSFWVVFYNKKMFAKYGLTAPTDWTGLMSTAAALKKNGVTPFLATQKGTWPSFIWFEALLSRLSPDFYTRLVNNQATYTDPMAVKAMQMWKSFYDREWFTKPDFNMDNGPATMKSGKLAMMPVGTWDNGAFAATGMKAGTDYDAFVMPPVSASTKPAVIVESTALTLPLKAPNHAAAKTVLEHWMDPMVQKVWSGFLQDNSANPSVVSPDPVIRSVVQTVKAKNMTQLGRYWEASPPNLIEENVQTLASFMIKPSSYESVLTKMAANAKTEWAAWNGSA